MVRFGSTRHGACCTVRLRGWVVALRAQVPGNGGLTSRSSRCRFAARLNSGVRPHMKHPTVLLLLIGFVVSGCASTVPTAACSAIAPSTEGWKPVPEPHDSPELLSLAKAPSGKALWYQRQPSELKACFYKRCGTTSYDFREQDGQWSVDLDVLTLCHPRSGA